MKKFIVILLSNFIFTISFAQTDAAYRIFGEIMTVENKVYKGFITWNGNKNYWIDFFPDFVNVSPKNHLQIMGRYVDVVS